MIVAANFFTVEAWTREGLTRFLVLFLIDLPTRRVEIAGLAKRANGLWMSSERKPWRPSLQVFGPYAIEMCNPWSRTRSGGSRKVPDCSDDNIHALVHSQK